METKQTSEQEQKQEKRYNRTWLAAQKYKGALIVNDPKWLL